MGSGASRAIGLENRGLAAPLTRVMREAALWVLGAIALIMLVALLSYSRQDPGFSHTGDGAPLQNQIGAVGAWFADVAFSLFGAPALLFPAMIMLAGWIIFNARTSPEPIDRTPAADPPVGFVLTLATSCALATLHFCADGLPQAAGGAFGELLGSGLAAGLGPLGATLLLLASGWRRSRCLPACPGWRSWIGSARPCSRASTAVASCLAISAAGARASAPRKSGRRRSQGAPEGREEAAAAHRAGAGAARAQCARPERAAGAAVRCGSAPGELPPLSLLDDPPEQPPGYSKESLEAMSRLVELKLHDFGVEVEVVAVQPGPIVTRFELAPAPGVKVSQISNLSKDLARSLSAISVRVVEVIPGKPTVGLEIPNETREIVTLGEILRSQAYEEMASPLTLALGKDIGGKSVVADLQRMPHLMIAGTTGSGKSVGINAMVLSLLYKARPQDVRMIMIDPKMLELSVYEGIPHLLAPVVTDMKEAANALRWCVAEMERRYRLMAALGVRNLVRLQPQGDAGRGQGRADSRSAGRHRVCAEAD